MGLGRIRLSNIAQLAGVPYKLLADLDFVDYEEGTPTENARRLNEGETDLALIPVVDYAAHGGYVNLEFGMGTRRRTDSMILYAKRPIEELRGVHIYQCSSSSMVLLRLLLVEKWQNNPPLMRRTEFEPFDSVGEDEGVLALHELPGMIRRDFPVVEDLGSVWYEHTGLPFVFLIWAARPGTLSAERCLLVNGAMHRAAKASRALAESYAEYYGTSPEQSAVFVGDNRRYYLDRFLLEGLNEFLVRARKLELLPRTRYQNITTRLFGEKSVSQAGDVDIRDSLAVVTAGSRLAIKDALALVAETSIEQLAGIVQKATSVRGDRSWSTRVVVLGEENLSAEKFAWGLSDREARLRFIPDVKALRPVYSYEKLLLLLRAQGPAMVEGFGVTVLCKLAAQHHMSLEEVIKRFANAGLDLVSDSEGGMLLEKKVALQIEEWTSTIRLLHHTPIRSSCCMRVSAEDLWEERLLHLQKLRTLQDESRGFAYFVCQDANNSDTAEQSELFLRSLLIARLFLDNIPVACQVSGPLTGSRLSVYSEFGIGEIEVISPAQS